MTLSFQTVRSNPGVQFGVSFNTKYADNLENARLAFATELNDARAAAQSKTDQKDPLAQSLSQIKDEKDPVGVWFRVEKDYAAADLQTRHNGQKHVQSKPGESARQFLQSVLDQITEWVPQLKSGKEHMAEIPILANQGLSDFVQAAQLSRVHCNPINNGNPGVKDSKEYVLITDRHNYRVVVHRQNNGNALTIFFDQEFHSNMSLEINQGVVRHFECKINDRPVIRVPSGRETPDEMQPDPAAIEKLQQNLISVVEALEGKKQLQDALS
jgi:hypothetical protein